MKKNKSADVSGFVFFGAILFKEIDPFFMLRLMHSTLNQLRAVGK
jgi:hypothetical protein